MVPQPWVKAEQGSWQGYQRQLPSITLRAGGGGASLTRALLPQPWVKAEHGSWQGYQRQLPSINLRASGGASLTCALLPQLWGKAAGRAIKDNCLQLLTGLVVVPHSPVHCFLNYGSRQGKAAGRGIP